MAQPGDREYASPFCSLSRKGCELRVASADSRQATSNHLRHRRHGTNRRPPRIARGLGSTGLERIGAQRAALFAEMRQQVIPHIHEAALPLAVHLRRRRPRAASFTLM
jgi:hypothetical protein